MAIFDTPVDATITEWQPTLAEYQDMVSQRDTANERYNRALSEISDLKIKIGNAGGIVMDYYSENGELTDELNDIGKYLGIPMTKQISGTASFEISWSAQVPLDFDVDDFEISFSAECESYDAEDFEWQEENSEVNGEDDY